MAINRVDYGEDTLIDISDSTVTPEYLRTGRVAYDKKGNRITGTFTPLDMSDATVTADKLLAGTVAYDKNGNRIVGTFVPLDTSDATITANDLKTGVVAYNSAGERVVGSNDTLLYMDIKNILTNNDPTVCHFTNCIYNLEGFDIPPTVRNLDGFIQSARNVFNFPFMDTSNVYSMAWSFSGCRFTLFPGINMSKVIYADGFLNGCANVVTIERLDFGSIQKCTSSLTGCFKLENVGGFLDFGKGFNIKVENSNDVFINLEASTLLTHDSLINIINDLYNLNLNNNLKSSNGTLYRQKIKFGSTNLEKLTADEIAIATNKGWNVS